MKALLYNAEYVRMVFNLQKEVNVILILFGISKVKFTTVIFRGVCEEVTSVSGHLLINSDSPYIRTSYSIFI